MKRIIAVLTVAVFGLVGAWVPAEAAPVKNLKDCDGVYSGTYRNVTVQAGGSCTLTADATVIGGVRAARGAKDLYVHTAVGHNIQAMGVTGTVMVGPEGCKYDPAVGNNIHVSKSHNVLICFASFDNNIIVTGNDGLITIRDSSAGNNVMVNRDLPYVADGTVQHKFPGAIRVLRTKFGNHLTTRANSGREVIRSGNTYVGH